MSLYYNFSAFHLYSKLFHDGVVKRDLFRLGTKGYGNLRIRS